MSTNARSLSPSPITATTRSLLAAVALAVGLGSAGCAHPGGPEALRPSVASRGRAVAPAPAPADPGLSDEELRASNHRLDRQSRR